MSSSPIPPPMPEMPKQVLPYVTPKSHQIVGGAWSEGEQMITTVQTTLPDRCVKCNAPADGYKLKKLFQWHPPGYYFLILAGVLVYAIVAMAIQKKATLYLGLCPVHRVKRTRMILIAWGLFAFSLLVGIGGAMLLYDNRETRDFTGLGVVLGIVIAIVSAVVGVVGSRVLKPTKIDHAYAWFKGASPEFLATLPPSQ